MDALLLKQTGVGNDQVLGPTEVQVCVNEDEGTDDTLAPATPATGQLVQRPPAANLEDTCLGDAALLQEDRSPKLACQAGCQVS